MFFAENEALSRIREETRRWLDDHLSGWGVTSFISLNFKEMRRCDTGAYIRLDERVARREIELFCKRIDRAIYGRLVQRFNRRVRRIPFLEFGHDRGWHAHVIIECPDAVAEVRFHHLVRKAWAESSWSTNLHDRMADEGAPSYLAKKRSKAELEAWIDTIVLEAVVVDTK
ncbi:hypothetical protein [Bradyrhizobium sp. SYSU BS000235]|uniref:hypothetical protein n=1 Tax=Bradyrhizobium sp. SYSU BS000235 TaxID=3411332 RepID=UPI003C775024